MIKPGTIQRRICWPYPDLTCLEGGCGYCNGYRFRNVESIRKAVERGEVHSHHRGKTGPDDTPLKSFLYGERNGWHNAESRVVA